MAHLRADNYLSIQGWMVTDLNLKGNELLIYALIYGFTQAEQQEYAGGQTYLAEWCNSTKRGVQKALASLVNGGFIEKRDYTVNGVLFCAYKVSESSLPTNKVHQGRRTEFARGDEQSSPSTTTDAYKSDSDNNNNINNNKNIVERVIAHLNEVAGTSYKHTTEATRKLIRARCAEGFTFDDFKSVINKQYQKWRGTEWEQYMRPATLFAPKNFEGYLNAPAQAKASGAAVPQRHKIEVPHGKR